MKFPSKTNVLKVRCRKVVITYNVVELFFFLNLSHRYSACFDAYVGSKGVTRELKQGSISC